MKHQSAPPPATPENDSVTTRAADPGLGAVALALEHLLTWARRATPAGAERLRQIHDARAAALLGHLACLPAAQQDELRRSLPALRALAARPTSDRGDEPARAPTEP